MQPTLTCPSCGLTALLPDGPPAQRICCPQCRTEFSVAEANPDPLAVWVGGAPRPSAPGADPVPDFSAEDAQAFAAWVRHESARLAEYVAAQLALLDKRRQELTSRESKIEAALIQRQQELGRDWAVLTARTAAADRREAALQGREADFERATADITARLADLTAREGRLPSLAARVADLEKREKVLWPMVEALEARRADAEAAEAELTAGRAALEKHLAAAERETKALERRAAELDELELRLRSEFEEKGAAVGPAAG